MAGKSGKPISASANSKRKYFNCSVLGCMNSTLTHGNMTFFSLPVDKQRRDEWLELIHREDLQDKAALHSRVCESHFPPNCVIASPNRKVLKKNSCPQLLLPDYHLRFANKEVQATVFTEQKFVQTEGPHKCDSHAQTPLHLLKDLKRKLNNESPICEKKIKIEKTEAEPMDEESMFLELCDKFIAKNLAEIVKKQVKPKLDNPENKFSLNYKIFCLKLFYTSPRAYNILKDTLRLPSKAALKKMEMPITTKIDDNLINIIQMQVDRISDMDRNCILVVDVIRLKENLSYNVKEDKLYGFHEVDGIQTTVPAKYVLVPMVQGLSANYKLPVGYALLAECKNYQSVSDWIDKLIQILFAIRLNVRLLVSHFGSDFLDSTRNRTVSPEKPYFLVGGRIVYCAFDTPRLMQLVHKDFLAYNFQFGESVAKWDHVHQFYEKDKTKTFRIAKKLTDIHMTKAPNFERTNSQYTSQVLSDTVVAGLSTYRDFGAIEESSEGTIKMISIMNNLYDLLSTSSSKGSTKYQNAFSGEDYQTSFINDALDFFDSLKLVNPNNGEEKFNVKFIEGFQITLKSIQLLFKDLKQEGLTHLLTGRLNQDCLQNLFDEIRTKSKNSAEPTSWTMVSKFRKVLLANIFKSSKEGNCTADDLTKILLEGEKLTCSALSFEGDPEDPTKMASNPLQSDCKDIIIPPILVKDYNTLKLPKKYALVYVSSGYLLQKCSEVHKECDLLNSYINYHESKEYFLEHPRYTRYANYCKDGGEKMKVIPADDFVEIVESMEEQFCKYFKMNQISGQILKRFTEEFGTVGFPAVPCHCFPVKYCLNLYFRMRLFFTLKRNNRDFRVCSDSQKKFTVESIE